MYRTHHKNEVENIRDRLCHQNVRISVCISHLSISMVKLIENVLLEIPWVPHRVEIIPSACKIPHRRLGSPKSFPPKHQGTDDDETLVRFMKIFLKKIRLKNIEKMSEKQVNQN